MFIVGIDAHKATHTAVAIDGHGTKAAEITVDETPAGHRRLVNWIGGLGDEVTVGVEDARHVTAGIEAALSAAGLVARRVPPHLTGVSRRSQRTQGKSDPIDAEAVARALAAHPNLPQADRDPTFERLRRLVRFRDQQVRARTGAVNQLRWELHALDPTWQPPADLTRTQNLRAVETRLAGHPDRHLALALVGQLLAYTEAINTVTAELTGIVTDLVPTVLAIPGIGPIGAATLAAHIGPTPTRFPTAGHFANHCGVAPIPISSGQTSRHRLNRGGNRQLNRVLHHAAITQARLPGAGRDYINRRTSQGKTRRDATRALKRHLATATYKALCTDLN